MKERLRSELAVTVTGAASYATGTFLPYIAPLLIEEFITRFELKPQIAGAIATGQFLLLSLSGLVVASMSDRIDARKTAILGAVLSAGGCLFALLANGVFAVSSALVLAYLGQGISGVSAYGIALAAKRPARSVAIMTSTGYLYGAIWLYVIPAMEIRHIGAHPTMLACAVGAIATCAVVLAGIGFVPSRQPTEPQPATAERGPLGRLSAVLLGSDMVVFAGGAAIWTFSVEIAKRTGMGLEVIGMVLSAAAIAGVIGPILVTVLRARYGLNAISAAALTFYVAGCFITGAGINAVTFSLAFLAISIVQGLLNPLVFEIGLHVDPTGRTSGSTYSFMFFGYALGPLIGGLAFGISSYSLGWASSAAALAGALGVGWVLLRVALPSKDLRSR